MISLEEINFTYGNEDKRGKQSTNSINNIDIRIKPGEFLVLTGGSGCGKTTITRVINGLIPNYYKGKLTGNVKIMNKETTNLNIHDIAPYVGSVFQNPRSQFFNVDTTSELAFTAENQGIQVEKIKTKIEKTIKEFKIQNLIGRSIFELSGGEKQKIACASVSVADTDIIVLDEPSSNLDSQAIEELKKVLTIWKKQGKTIIIAEHRLYYIKELADRMLVMKDGKITDEITYKQIQNLSSLEIKEKNLRSLDIENLTLSSHKLEKSKKHITIHPMKFIYKNSNHGINTDRISIKEKSIVAIIGHNGAGKSTFARCLCGLENKCNSLIELDGKKLKNKDKIKNCYMVMQDVNNQLFTESVLDEVLLSLEDGKLMNEEEKEKRAKEILYELDLEKFQNEHPMALSGGQKQRVAIASAIASLRKIIIFDEPTSGLDYFHMQQVATNIKKLSTKGKTIFVITHDLEFILNCCTDILHLEKGRVEEIYELNNNSVNKLIRFFTGHEKVI